LLNSVNGGGGGDGFKRLSLLDGIVKNGGERERERRERAIFLLAHRCCSIDLLPFKKEKDAN
jgi:hypothetical protein